MEFVKAIHLSEAQVKKIQDLKQFLLNNNVSHIEVNLFSYMKVKKGEEVEIVSEKVKAKVKAKIKENTQTHTMPKPERIVRKRKSVKPDAILLEENELLKAQIGNLNAELIEKNERLDSVDKEVKTLIFDKYLRETNNAKEGNQSVVKFFGLKK